MESSTTRPVASASPPSDITLRLRPNCPMKKNVAMIDTGSDSEITNVLQPSRRNRKMIRIDEQAADHRVQLDVAVMALTDELTDWSSMVTVSSMSCGQLLADLSRFFWRPAHRP
jgi:hypothetical protein